jgi:hypothetical protein
MVDSEFANPEGAEYTEPDGVILEIRFSDSLFFVDRSSYYSHSSRQTWSLNDSTIQIVRSEILGVDTSYWSIIMLDDASLSIGNENKTLHFRKLK